MLWDTILEVTMLTAAEFAPIGAGLGIALIIALLILEVIMSLYHAIANRWVTPVIEQHEARGRAKGIAETNASWQEWLDRKNVAEASGQEFTEPNPGERRKPKSG